MTRAPAWLVALACLSTLATSACATLPPCPARGGPAWTEWTSAHFVLMTDLDEADARAALRGFEELRAAVLVAAWRRAPEPRGRLAVVAFRSDSERRVFVRPGFVAAFIATKAQQGLIVKSGAERDEIVTHALVLALAYHYGLEGKAAWFDEGLARYLESLRLEPDGTLTYGDVDDVIFRNVTRGLLASFENLWEPVTPATRQSFIVTSWLAVHYLFNNEPERFLDFQRRLLLTSDARAAWRAAFPGSRPARWTSASPRTPSVMAPSRRSRRASRASTPRHKRRRSRTRRFTRCAPCSSRRCNRLGGCRARRDRRGLPAQSDDGGHRVRAAGIPGRR